MTNHLMKGLTLIIRIVLLMLRRSTHCGTDSRVTRNSMYNHLEEILKIDTHLLALNIFLGQHTTEKQLRYL